MKEESAAIAKSDASEAEAKTEDPEDAETEPEKPAASAEEIQSLKDESQVLHLSPTLSGDLQGVEISPEEGFLLSRIDCASRPNDVISVSPMADADTARALMDLLGKGLIRLGGVTREPVASAPEPPPPLPPKPKPKPPQGPDAAAVSEVDRLLALAESADYPALLGAFDRCDRRETQERLSEDRRQVPSPTNSQTPPKTFEQSSRTSVPQHRKRSPISRRASPQEKNEKARPLRRQTTRQRRRMVETRRPLTNAAMRATCTIAR